mmetsp:Transcript_5730/g.17887  ORF Transcript_5730/g.17887 Transcript_5730/m.17887 type:complete len:297 (-) Transcript_5730:650-1540(-)|eukprot:scaffold291929_cov28-Tisochrysis_lutea.AAC.2
MSIDRAYQPARTRTRQSIHRAGRTRGALCHSAKSPQQRRLTIGGGLVGATSNLPSIVVTAFPRSLTRPSTNAATAEAVVFVIASVAAPLLDVGASTSALRMLAHGVEDVAEVSVFEPASSSSTRPSSSTSISPVLSESCCARMSRFPSTALQYGASVQCAEPVTLSSAIPMVGAKNREEKWKGWLPSAALTMTPRNGMRAIKARSGSAALTIAASGTTTNKSSDAPITSINSSGRRSANAISSFVGAESSFKGAGGVAGKSSSISPSARRIACSSPERVEKRRTSLSRPAGREKSA